MNTRMATTKAAATAKRNALRRKFAIAGLAAISVIVAYIAINYYRDEPVPLLSEQPIDTRVSNGVLQLHHWQTAQGSSVYFVPTEQPAIVDIMVVFDAGAARDENLPGLSSLTANLIGEGTAKYDADTIAESFEQVGAQYFIDHNLESARFHLRSLIHPKFVKKKKLYELTSLFAEIIAKPSFPQANIERLKQQQAVALAIETEDPNVVAYKRFMRAIYNEHPYSNPSVGTEVGIKAITYDDIKQFHQRYYVAKNAAIVIVGSIHRDTAKAISEIVDAALPIGEQAAMLPEVTLPAALVEDWVKFPAKQTHIYLGQPGRVAGDPDYFPLEVGNQVLGGSENSKLFDLVRNNKGLAYSIYSDFQGMQKLGPFYLNLQTKSGQEHEAVDLIKQTLTNFVQVGPSDAEITLAKEQITGSFPLLFTSNRKILNAVADMAFYKLPYNFFDSYIMAVNNVNKEDIMAAFNKRVRPENMALVVVGERVKGE